jgi:hypothetical protein
MESSADIDAESWDEAFLAQFPASVESVNAGDLELGVNPGVAQAWIRAALERKILEESGNETEQSLSLTELGRSRYDELLANPTITVGVPRTSPRRHWSERLRARRRKSS